MTAGAAPLLPVDFAGDRSTLDPGPPPASGETVTDRKAKRRLVDWPLVIGPDLHLPVRAPAPPSRGVVSVLAAADELQSYADLDTVLRRAVELVRDRIGLERVAIFIQDEAGEVLFGTWGTGLAGETTDERDIFFHVGDNHREAQERAAQGVSRWLVLQGAPLMAQIGDEARVVGEGWVALTPIRSARGAVGLMVNDTALSGAPLDEAKQMQAAVFCSMLGNIIELRRDEGSALPWTPALVRTHLGVDRQGATNPSLAAAVRALHADPRLDARALAKQLGINSRKLTAVFNDELGVSLVDYRNRLRLERFLALVDRGGGNLLQAALDAGFGSYAQFHRVFRAVLGATPREYLRGKG